MLTREQKRAFRSDLFRHLDGLVTAPTAYVLHEHSVLEFILEQKSCSLSEITSKFKANEGYMNVALRILCSQGWLECKVGSNSDSIIYSVNALSETAFEHCNLYKDVVELLRKSADYHPRIFNKEIFGYLESIFRKFQDNYGIEPSEDEEKRNIQKSNLKAS